jgi:hypothetical protein
MSGAREGVAGRFDGESFGPEVGQLDRQREAEANNQMNRS